jgi:DNA polymerase-4
MQRKIIHVDMDAFYASIEQLDNPELLGRPVIVGGRPDSRGVVAACSYEARVFGVRSAMPCSRAYARCPEAVFIHPRLDRYRQVSARIMTIFRSYTDLVEPLSLDEAFLDVTVNKRHEPSATVLAERIRHQIREETGLTASAGVSFNKFIAKIASDLNKPDGLSVIRPEMAASFLATLPIGSFFGVGAVTERRMHQQGSCCGADLLKLSLAELSERFGKQGVFLYHIVRGHDHRPVQPERERKSIGAETTLERDTKDPDRIDAILARLAERVGHTLHRKHVVGTTVTLKVRYADFTTVTRSVTGSVPSADPAHLFASVRFLLGRTEAGKRKVRLLGISVSNLSPLTTTHPRQLLLPFISRHDRNKTG